MHSINGNMTPTQMRGSWKSWFPKGLQSLEVNVDAIKELEKGMISIKTSGKSYLCGLYAIFHFLQTENFTPFSKLVFMSNNALTENAIAALYYICGGKKNLFFLEAIEKNDHWLVKRVIGVIRKYKKDNSIFLVNQGFHWEPIIFGEGKPILRDAEFLCYSFDPDIEDLLKPSDVDYSGLVEEIKRNPSHDSLLQFVKDLLDKNLTESFFHKELENYIADESIKSHMSLLWYQKRNIQNFTEEKMELYKEYLLKEEIAGYKANIDEIKIKVNESEIQKNQKEKEEEKMKEEINAIRIESMSKETIQIENQNQIGSFSLDTLAQQMLEEQEIKRKKREKKENEKLQNKKTKDESKFNLIEQESKEEIKEENTKEKELKEERKEEENENENSKKEENLTIPQIPEISIDTSMETLAKQMLKEQEDRLQRKKEKEMRRVLENKQQLQKEAEIKIITIEDPKKEENLTIPQTSEISIDTSIETLAKQMLKEQEDRLQRKKEKEILRELENKKQLQKKAEIKEIDIEQSHLQEVISTKDIEMPLEEKEGILSEQSSDKIFDKFKTPELFYNLELNKNYWRKYTEEKYTDRTIKDFDITYLDKIQNFELIIPKFDYFNGLYSIIYYLEKMHILVDPLFLISLLPALIMNQDTIVFLFEAMGGHANLIFLRSHLVMENYIWITEVHNLILSKSLPFFFFCEIDNYYYAMTEGNMRHILGKDSYIFDIEILPDTILDLNDYPFYRMEDLLLLNGFDEDKMGFLKKIISNLEKVEPGKLEAELLSNGIPQKFFSPLKEYISLKQNLYLIEDFKMTVGPHICSKPILHESKIITQQKVAVLRSEGKLKEQNEFIAMDSSNTKEFDKLLSNQIPSAEETGLFTEFQTTGVAFLHSEQEMRKKENEIVFLNKSKVFIADTIAWLLIYCENSQDFRIGLLNRKFNYHWNLLLTKWDENGDLLVFFKHLNVIESSRLLIKEGKYIFGSSIKKVNPLLTFFPTTLLKCIGQRTEEIFSFYKTSFGIMGQWQFYKEPLDYLAHINQSNILVIYENINDFFQYFEINANVIIIIAINEEYYLPNIPLYVTLRDMNTFLRQANVVHVNHIDKTEKTVVFDKINCFKIVRNLLISFQYTEVSNELLKLIQLGIYKFRHDMIVYMVYKTYGYLNWSEKSLKEDFPGISFESSLLTPDFFIIKQTDKGKSCFIYEISVTIKPVLMKQEKIRKYERLVSEINNMCAEGCFLIPLILQPNLAHMQRTFSEYMPTVSGEILNFVWTTVNQLTNVLLKINSKIGSPFGDMPKIVEVKFEPSEVVKAEEDKIANFLDRSLSLRAIYQFSEGVFNDFYLSSKPHSNRLSEVLIFLKKQTEKYHTQISPKPTFHFLIDPLLSVYPDPKLDTHLYYDIKLSEERIVIDFFQNHLAYETDFPASFDFLYEFKRIFNKLENHVPSLEMFLKGEISQFKRQEFEEINERLSELKKPKMSNYLKMASEKIGLKKSDFISRYHKAIHMNKPSKNAKAFEFYKKAGIRSKFYNEFNRQPKTVSKTLFLDEKYFMIIENFLEKMTVTLTRETFAHLPDFLTRSDHIMDHAFVQKTKQIMHDEMNPILGLLSKTLIYEFAYRYHLFAAQMMHIGSFKGRESNYYFITTGIKNIICCIAGRKEKRNTDPGVSFFFFGYLPKLDKDDKLTPEEQGLPIEVKLFSEVFGDIDYLNSKGKILFCSSWRRIKKTKLAFINDVFFSTLTSALCDLSLHSSKSRSNKITLNDVREFYTIRVVFGLNASQRNAEMAMDLKFAVLASLSDYSRLTEQLKEKFGPIYSSHLNVWFVFNLIRICRTLLFAQENNLPIVKLNAPEFIEDIRQLKSAGGSLYMPGLWSRASLIDFNLFLNSIHTYVHTIKEPVSLHYESIKAMKTILKFDKIYKQKSEDLRYGLTDEVTLPAILQDVQSGFSNSFIYYNTILFFEKYPIDFNFLLADNIFKMPLSHLTSTKASILTSSRPLDNYKRYKVHDCLVLRPEMQKMNLISHAQYCFEQQKLYGNIVSLADICIKEQYGAKREFYVLDINSKFLCKFVEEIFKRIAKLVDTECISVPGDLKLLKIQSLVNTISRHAATNSQTTFYINGDCTKWSASEMLESFLTLLYGMKKILPEPLFYLLFSIVHQWKTNKYIQIPETLIKKCDIQTGMNDYTFDGVERILRLKLEQNFLMGLFNYLSSIKGSIVYNSFKSHIEVKFENVKIEHLEHSDDYLIGVSCRPDQIIEIRNIQMKFMRLGGITDSIKKTTISHWYAEFVSLYCFNGHMTYPNIKKTKEVSSALTGNGFQEDSAAVGSRTAEVLRVGVTFTNAFIFLKMHNWLLADLYSLLPGQRNEDKFNLLGLFSKPVEAFGLSECHPLLYLINSGDVNNLRLYKYEPLSYKLLTDLNLNNFQEFTIEEAHEGVVGFKKPLYNFKMSGVKLNRLLKEIGINLEDGRAFWEEHPALKYHKPNIPVLFSKYLEAHYSIKQFQRAYEQQSRLSTLLKISRYKAKKVLHAPYFSEKLMSIRDYLEYLSRIPIKDKKSELREEFLTNGDTSGVLFYEMLIASEYRITPEMNRVKSLAANVTPFYYDPVKVDTPISFLLLKKYEPLLFAQEESYISLKWPIDEDMKTLERLDKQFEKLPESRRINFIYNYMMCGKKPVRAIMTPFPERKELLSFIIEMFKFQTSLNVFVDFKLVKEIRFINPINPGLACYMFQGEEMTLERAISLNIISIYTCLKFKDKLPIGAIKNYFEKLKLITGQNTLEFLNNIKYSDLNYLGFKYSEIHSLMFMKAELCYDYQQIVDFLQIWNSYSFRYKRRANLINNKYVGDTMCEFTHFDTDNLVLFFERTKETILLTNTKSLHKVYVALMIGAKLVQREFTKDWFIGDVDKALDKYFMTFQEMTICKIKMSLNLKEDLKKEQLNVLIQENGALNWVIANFDDNKNLKNYLPIFQISKYTFQDRPVNFNKMDFSDALEIDTKSASLLLKPGGWVASRFGTSHIYTNPDLFINLENFTLGGLKLEFVLKSSRLKKLFFHEDSDLFIDTLDANVVLEEIPRCELERFNMAVITDQIPLYENFKELTHPSFSKEERKEKRFFETSSSAIDLSNSIFLADDLRLFKSSTTTGTVKINTMGNTSFKDIIKYDTTEDKQEEQISQSLEVLLDEIETGFEDLEDKVSIVNKENLSKENVNRNEKINILTADIDTLESYKQDLKRDTTGVYFTSYESWSKLITVELIEYQPLDMSDSDEEIEKSFSDNFFPIGLEGDDSIGIEKIHMKIDSETVHLSSFLKQIKTNQSLWQDALEIIIKNMLIKGLGYSKFLILFIGIMFGKYDHYIDIFHNDFHKQLLNKIKHMIENKPLWPNVEYLEYMPYSIRLENKQLILYEYKFFIMAEKMTEERERQFIINDNKPCDYTQNRIRFEKRIPKKDLAMTYYKISELFLNLDVFKWHAHEFMPYNPFIYMFINSRVKASSQEVFEDWLDK